jgi:hypothetical protein
MNDKSKDECTELGCKILQIRELAEELNTD